MVLLLQKLIYSLNESFNFVSGLFFEQDHLLNLIILGVIGEGNLNVCCTGSQENYFGSVSQ